MRKDIRIVRYIDLFECFKDFWASPTANSKDNSYWKHIYGGVIPMNGSIGWDDIKDNIKHWADSGEAVRFVWSDKIDDDRFLNIWFSNNCPPVELLKAMKSELEYLYVPRFRKKSKDEEEQKSMLKNFYIELTMKYYTQLMD